MRSNTVARRAARRPCWRSASPPAAATTARAPAAAARRAARARRASRAARSTARARRSRHPSTTSGPPRFKDQTGTTVNYQAIGSGGGIAQFTAGHRRLRRHRRGDEGRGGGRGQEEGRRRSTSRPCSARSPCPTTSAASTSGLKLDGATVADIFLGKIKKWNDPAIAQLNSGVKLPTTNITVCHRSDESGTTKIFTDVPGRLLARVEERPGRRQDRQVADRHRRQGQRRRRRRVKQTDGAVGYVEQAYALQNNFTSADVKNKAGNVRRADARVDLGRRRGHHVPTDLRFSTRSTRPAPNAYPITSADVPARLPGPVQGRHTSRATAKLREELARLRRSATARRSLPSCSTRRCPTPMQAEGARPRSTALQCNGSSR